MLDLREELSAKKSDGLKKEDSSALTPHLRTISSKLSLENRSVLEGDKRQLHIQDEAVIASVLGRKVHFRNLNHAS